MYDPTELRRRSNEFLLPSGRSVGSRLGFGRNGIVWTVESQSQFVISSRTAIKVHARTSGYERERDAYLRLQDLGITQVRLHHLPIIVEFNDPLMSIEMTIVSPPFVLDFADAYLDRPPTFSDEALEDWREEKR